MIDNFSCKFDKDIENFFKDKSLLFQQKNKAKTYLILDNDKLEQGNFSILAYFALSTKVLHLPDELSKSQRKKNRWSI